MKFVKNLVNKVTGADIAEVPDELPSLPQRKKNTSSNKSSTEHVSVSTQKSSVVSLEKPHIESHASKQTDAEHQFFEEKVTHKTVEPVKNSGRVELDSLGDFLPPSEKTARVEVAESKPSITELSEDEFKPVESEPENVSSIESVSESKPTTSKSSVMDDSLYFAILKARLEDEQSLDAVTSELKKEKVISQMNVQFKKDRDEEMLASLSAQINAKMVPLQELEQSWRSLQCEQDAIKRQLVDIELSIKDQTDELKALIKDRAQLKQDLFHEQALQRVQHNISHE